MPPFVHFTNKLSDPTRNWEWSDENRQDLAQLADAMTQGTVVSYVGAGPSISAGLKGWKKTCSELCDWTIERKKPAEKDEQQFLRQLLQKENFPLLVQLIDNQYRGNTEPLYDKLIDMFRQPASSPADAHVAIALLPIPLRLTTNYEKLLEIAIQDLPEAFAPTRFIEAPLTWLDGAKLLSLVRSRKPGVIKLHGDFSKPGSIVLTSNHYRTLSHEKAFSSVLQSLISTYCLLFIGCSLRDPDLFTLLDEIIENCRVFREGQQTAVLPMHYALLPRRFANPIFVSHLRSNYGIATLPVPEDQDGVPLLPAVLRLISGEVAKRMQVSAFPGVGDRPRTHSSDAHLGEIIRITGSHRGDIVLADNDQTHQLRRWLEWDKTTTGESARWVDGPPIRPGVISSTFTQQVAFMYVRDVQAVAESGVPYMEKDKRVRSELAVPIMAGGTRVGVLNLESYLPDAYNQGHLDFLQQQAALIGSEYLSKKMRNRRLSALNLNRAKCKSIMTDLRNLYPGAGELDGIFYKADYFETQLHGLYFLNQGDTIHLHDSFESPQPSFALDVFRSGQAKFFSHVEENWGRINTQHADQVGLTKGPLFGTQIFDRGLPCGLLVLWGNQQGGESSFRECGLRDRLKQRFLAATANFIIAGNLHDPTLLREVLRQIEEIRRTDEKDRIYLQTAKAIKLLGLKRLRIWDYLGSQGKARIGFASPELHKNVVGVEETWVSGSISPQYSTYCALILGRYKTDPWARAQGPNLVNAGPDPLAERLEKSKEDPWLVAPLVSSGPATDGDIAETSNDDELLGYLAADNVPEQLDCTEENILLNFLQCGMSVISVAMTLAIRELQEVDTNTRAARAF